MNIILKILSRIWNWIKNTAWIQPLIIVGTVFGIIFSIPYTTKAIQKKIDEIRSVDHFYKKYKIKFDDKNSYADCILTNYENYKLNKIKKITKKEKKYFLFFTKEKNDLAKDFKFGIEKISNIDSDFYFYVIYVDDLKNDKLNLNFSNFFNRHNLFFKDVFEIAKKNNCENDIEWVNIGNCDYFKLPFMVLIDWKNDHHGVTKVITQINGNNDYQKAAYLYDYWINN